MKKFANFKIIQIGNKEIDKIFRFKIKKFANF